MSLKARAQLHREYAQAQQVLAQVECDAARSCVDCTPIVLLVTAREIAMARAKVADLERQLSATTPQLALFP